MMLQTSLNEGHLQTFIFLFRETGTEGFTEVVLMNLFCRSTSAIISKTTEDLWVVSGSCWTNVIFSLVDQQLKPHDKIFSFNRMQSLLKIRLVGTHFFLPW